MALIRLYGREMEDGNLWQIRDLECVVKFKAANAREEIKLSGDRA